MSDSQPAAERRGRALMGVVAASALVYPLLVCAVQLVVAQLLARRRPAAVACGCCCRSLCSVAVVAAVRWGAARRVRSPLAAARPAAAGAVRAVAGLAPARAADAASGRMAA